MQADHRPERASGTQPAVKPPSYWPLRPGWLLDTPQPLRDPRLKEAVTHHKIPAPGQVVAHHPTVSGEPSKYLLSTTGLARDVPGALAVVGTIAARAKALEGGHNDANPSSTPVTSSAGPS